MSKTAKEKAHEWECSISTVKRYCASGIIPPAEQIGFRKTWMIPDDWEKPPMTRHKLCYLLDTIYQLKHGVKIEKVKWGIDKQLVIEGYKYLILSAFVSSFDVEDIEHALVDAIVTPRGENLIERENNETESKSSYKAHIKGEVKLGVASIGGEFEVSNE